MAAHPLLGERAAGVEVCEDEGVGVHASTVHRPTVKHKAMMLHDTSAPLKCRYPPRMIDVHRLRIFRSVVANGSIQAAADILAKYITPDLRFDPVEVGDADLETHVRELIERIVDRLYTRDASTTYVHLVYASGRRSSLYLADLTSGAMLRNIVDRAKKLAIKDKITEIEDQIIPDIIA